MAASRWDGSRDDRDQAAGRGPRSARSRWNPPGSGYQEDQGETAPETGRWSARQDRWIPQPRSTDDTDYRIKRFVDDTGDMSIPPQRPGQGQVLDHDEFWSTRRVDPAPPQPGDPYWGSPSPPNEPVDPYWGAPQPPPPQPPRFIRRPPAAGPRMSAPPMSPPAPPMSPPVPPMSRPRPEPPPPRPQPPRPQPPWPEPIRPRFDPEPPPRFDAEPPPAPRYDDYRRTSEQTDWRTGEYRWGGANDAFSRVPDDDYADFDAPVDDDDDEIESPGPRNYIYAALAALGWFIIPVAIYLGYAFLLNDQPPPGCNGASTPECLTPRAEALQNLFGNVPLVTITVSVSILIALVLRRVASGWRTLTVGFASAVVGAGAATVLFTVVSN